MAEAVSSVAVVADSATDTMTSVSESGGVAVTTAMMVIQAEAIKQAELGSNVFENDRID
jgi:hypothetical protein